MRDHVDPELFVPNPGTDNCNPESIKFWVLVAEDFHTHGRKPSSQGFWTLFWHRFGNWRMGVRNALLRKPLSIIYNCMFFLCQIFCGIMLPYTTRVGRRVKLEHFGGMVLVAQSIGDDVIIRQNTTFGISSLENLGERPVIGNNVEIGAGVVVIGNTYIGNGTIIGANAVVSKDIPPNVVAGGIPAKVLFKRKD